MAVENIAELGDTDVFPLPIENHVFFDRTDSAVALLLQLHGTFDEAIADEAPENISTVAMIGHTAFRWVTQIDPIWNAYLLGLVLSLAEEIERVRVPREQETVFSYRFAPDLETKRLFVESGWREFNERSRELSERHEYVTQCDISDFYARVYHHRLENALNNLRTGADTPKRIDRLLSQFSNGTSYGLPVGGPAARILSELVLNQVDRLLLAEGITFCRFADDYRMFTDSKEEAYEALLFLTEKLLQNQGLTLQRAKTRIQTAREFQRLAELSPTAEDRNLPVGVAESRGVGAFLSLSLRYDPYSPTAEEDYATLVSELKQFDIVGMLASELSKTRVHSSLTRRLLMAIRFLSPSAKDRVSRSLVENLETLAPLFPSVARALISSFDLLSDEGRQQIADEFRKVLIEQRYYVMVPVNLSYAVRLLSREQSPETVELLVRLYDSAPPFVQRDIVLAMARWNIDWWLADKRAYYQQMHPWVRRAFLIGSYSLGDEGSHWRGRATKGMGAMDLLVRDWMAEKSQLKDWEIPL